jgi:hypothetical protein
MLPIHRHSQHNEVILDAGLFEVEALGYQYGYARDIKQGLELSHRLKSDAYRDAMQRGWDEAQQDREIGL